MSTTAPATTSTKVEQPGSKNTIDALMTKLADEGLFEAIKVDGKVNLKAVKELFANLDSWISEAGTNQRQSRLDTVKEAIKAEGGVFWAQAGIKSQNIIKALVEQNKGRFDTLLQSLDYFREADIMGSLLSNLNPSLDTEQKKQFLQDLGTVLDGVALKATGGSTNANQDAMKMKFFEIYSTAAQESQKGDQGFFTLLEQGLEKSIDSFNKDFLLGITKELKLESQNTTVKDLMTQTTANKKITNYLAATVQSPQDLHDLHKEMLEMLDENPIELEAKASKFYSELNSKEFSELDVITALENLEDEKLKNYLKYNAKATEKNAEIKDEVSEFVDSILGKVKNTDLQSIISHVVVGLLGGSIFGSPLLGVLATGFVSFIGSDQAAQPKVAPPPAKLEKASREL